MKKNNNPDWTSVLQERLQDARLPLVDGWGASAAAAGRTAAPWWPWALAGLGAAILTAILLLRPAAPVPPEEAGAPLLAQTTVPPEPEAPAVEIVPARMPAPPAATPARPLNLPAAALAETPVLSDEQGQPESTVAAPAGQKTEPEEAKPARENTPFEEPAQGRPARPGRVSLRVQAGFAGASLASGGIAGAIIPHEIYSDSGYGLSYSEKPESVQPARAIPVSFGVSAGIPLSRSWALIAGLDYTQRAGWRQFSGSKTRALTLHYLGVPLDLHYYFNPESRLRFYLGAGLHAGKSIAATGGERVGEPFLFSGNLSAGADFRLLPGIRLYLAPAVSGFFNRSAYLNDWDDKALFQLRAGLSFDL